MSGTNVVNQNIRAINKWCLKNISVRGKKYSFPDVIKADYDEIVEIANVYNSRRTKIPKKSNVNKSSVLNFLLYGEYDIDSFALA